MTMANANPNTRVLICDLLNKLPVELRLDIYKYTFAGSRVQATLANNDESPSDHQTGGVVLRPSNHFNLLLTCRTIYHEALNTYWSETVLQLKFSPVVFGSLRTFEHSKLKLDTHAHRLCTSLPEAAKANIKHVRGMVLPALKSLWVKENPALTAPALLGLFKNLATCDMTPTLAHPVDGLLSHYEDLEDECYSRFRTVWGYEASEFLAHRYGIVNVDQVAFIFKGRVKFSVHMDADNADRAQRLMAIRPMFWNFSTGLAFKDATRKMDDEEGYEKVLRIDV